jgi:hypothetical protein
MTTVIQHNRPQLASAGNIAFGHRLKMHLIEHFSVLV